MINALALYLKQCQVISLTHSWAAITKLVQQLHDTFDKVTFDSCETIRQSRVLCNILHCLVAFPELLHYISTLQYDVTRRL